MRSLMLIRMRAIRLTPTQPTPMGVLPPTAMAMAVGIGLTIRIIITLAVTGAIIAVIAVTAVMDTAVIMGPVIVGRGLEWAFTDRTSASDSAPLAVEATAE